MTIGGLTSSSLLLSDDDADDEGDGVRGEAADALGIMSMTPLRRALRAPNGDIVMATEGTARGDGERRRGDAADGDDGAAGGGT